MSPPSVVARVDFAVRDASRPLLVLGPSLGTSVTAAWHDAIALLAPHVDLVGWDLPGHGASGDVDQPAELGGLSIQQLAREVDALARSAQDDRGAQGQPYWYAGVSVGGAVGLQVMIDSPGSVAGAALVCTGARIGTHEHWSERAALVERAGTPTQVTGAAQRWFAPGFIEAHPDVTTRLLASLQTTDRHGYAAVCRALADFDAREQLNSVTVPVVAIAGEHDAAAPVADMAALAAGVSDGRLAVLSHVAHQAPAEAPGQVAALIIDMVRGATSTSESSAGRQARAITTRRDVLGHAHVDAAIARTSAFTADFQNLITGFAWGEVWGRPGLDRRLRSVAALTALIAGGHWEEFPMHVRAALRNGLTRDEIREVLLQSAIYCSVPSANHAFAIADQVLSEDDEEPEG
jgi:3-oxoadipate enol-lactonase/4-carboxymuconolactone decarboxylase